MASSLSRQQAIAGLVSSALWISLSLSVAIGSKWLYTVQRFAFPLFVTLVWSAVILVGSSLIVFVSKSDENSTFAKLRSSWRLLLFNAACVGLSSALESVALDATSISLNQVSSEPSIPIESNRITILCTRASIQSISNLIICLRYLSNPTRTNSTRLNSIGLDWMWMLALDDLTGREGHESRVHDASDLHLGWSSILAHLDRIDVRHGRRCRDGDGAQPRVHSRRLLHVAR